MTNNPQYLIVHHGGGTDADPLANTSNHTAETINAWHRHLWNFKSSLGWYVGYHYVIEKSGKVVQCRADNEEGAHCIGKNRSSIGIVLCGNFDSTVPTKEQEEALRLLIQRLAKKHNIAKSAVVPHRKFVNKSCYGRRLPDDWAAAFLSEIDNRTALSEYSTIELIAELRRRW